MTIEFGSIGNFTGTNYTSQASYVFNPGNTVIQVPYTVYEQPIGYLAFASLIGSNCDKVSLSAVSIENDRAYTFIGGLQSDTVGEPGRVQAYYYTSPDLNFGGNMSPSSGVGNGYNHYFTFTNTTTSALTLDLFYACIIVRSTRSPLYVDGYSWDPSMYLQNRRPGPKMIISNQILEEVGDQAISERTIYDDGPGSRRICIVYSGGQNTPAVGANTTLLYAYDFGNYTINVGKETVAGPGSRTVGFVANSDDYAGLYFAVKEGSTIRKIS